MAFGDCPEDLQLREAWHAFCARLAEAGDLVFKDFNPANPLQRADAMRFLTQNLGQAFDLALETRDPAFPMLHAFCTPSRKLGADAADLTYHQAWIDGAHTYRVSGVVGTARFFNVTVQGARPEVQPGTGWPSLHEPFGDIPEQNLFGHQLQVQADGSFELFLGGESRVGNWLPTTNDTRKLFIRQGFDAWHETPARLTIERLDMSGPRPLPSPARMCEAMDWAGGFLTGMMRDWPDHPYQYSGGVVDPQCLNAFPENLTANTADDEKRGRQAAHLCWELAPEQALVVEFDGGDEFWMVSLGGAFMNSLDYLYRPVSYTPARTNVDRDGRIRLILSSADPGYHNWLDTQGFAAGNLTWRCMNASMAPNFRTQLVQRDELPHVLPPDSAKTSRDERSAQMLVRASAIRQRFGL